MKLRVMTSVLVAGVAAGSLLLSACSSGTTGGGATNSPPTSVDTAGAKKMVAAAEAEITSFPAPGPAFDASKAKGKTVWFENYDASSSTTAIWRNAFIDAMKPMGVNVDTFDGKSQISEQGRGIEQAIAQKVDLIILSGIDPKSVAAPLADVKRAGIPVIVGSTGISEASTDPNVAAYVSIDHTRVGQLLAASAVASKGKDADIAMITHSAITGTQVLVDGVKNELSKLCSSCKFASNDLPFSQINTLPQLGQQLIQTDPSLSYIMPVYDFETLNMLSAVQAASPTVKLASFNANPGVLKAMQTGTTISYDVGAPNQWVGWAYGDQTLRILSGLKPVADERIPLRLFTPDIAKKLDLSQPEATWYGSVDFKAEFTKLWSGSK